ncbi:MAG: thiamine diphosphokinase [Candidatus Cloacimonetes bacterium HGW-Cloacimonetes-3]|jgi:thiamine pyrophosphokinase|nr:MAG: thiamine diphosphokinase [Candidatus Cloacimonetes bacterium HGW-Cloacimonetes-3]
MPCAKPSRRAYLFTNHAPEQIVSGYENIENTDHIIAVDNGLQRIHELGLTPTIIIGDMDSVKPALLKQYSCVPMHKHPAEKKETDTELALLWCIQQGVYSEIIICNDMQGRFDHALAIVQNLMLMYGEEAIVRVETDNQVIFLLEETNSFDFVKGHILSIIPLSETVEFSSSAGLKYPLDGLQLLPHQSRGISNEFTADKAELVMCNGEALAIITISN